MKNDPVDPAFWTTRAKFGVAGGPLERVLTDEGAARAFQVGAQLAPAPARALEALANAGGAVVLEERTGAKVRPTAFLVAHGASLLMLTARALAENTQDEATRVVSIRLTDTGRAAAERGKAEQRSLLERVRRVHPI